MNSFGAAAECHRLAACARQKRAGGIVSICHRKSQIYNRKPTTRVAELADAPDLGLRNHRFQSVASRFKTKPLHDRKTLNFREILHSANTEQRTRHSSTNSSTRTHQSQAPARLTIGGGRRTS